MEYRVQQNGSVLVLFCERQKRWLPVDEHVDCEHCAGPVYDSEDEPVSFMCTYAGEVRTIQPDHEDTSEEGYGYPSDPGKMTGQVPEDQDPR